MNNLPDDFSYGHEDGEREAIGQAYADANSGRTAYRLAEEWRAKAEHLRQTAASEEWSGTEDALRFVSTARAYQTCADEISTLGDFLSEAV